MSAADNYQALSDTEHVLLRPSMYIGSCEPSEAELFIWDDGRIVSKRIIYNAGLVRIYEEILLNAFDHTIRDPTCTEIRVAVDRERGAISVANNGAGIPVVKKPELGIYIPEMLFGMLRSGSNFDESKTRTVGGQNGLGGSLANLFSEEFTIQTIDATTKKQYTQTWRNNMRDKEAPVIKASRAKPRTTVTFVPDLSRFGLPELSADLIMLIKKRLVDIGYASSAKVRTFFDDEEISIKKPLDYIQLYEHPEDEKPIIDCSNERWSVGVVLSDRGFQHASFVNGIHTNLGGTHVDAVSGQIAKEIVAKLATKKISVKPSDVRSRMFLFVRAVVDNPTFNSQTKECLSTPRSKFGGEFSMSDAFRKKVLASSIVKAMAAVADNKLLKDLSKTNGAKKSRLCDIDNLEDATWAGTPARSLRTKLILTEGMSARTFAMSALNVIGRDRFGIFPLRGKMLNVRNVAISRVSANEEIKNIVRIVGLRYDLRYDSDDDMRTLRYGGIVSLTDADLDGYHISGLIVNYFHTFWPELVARGFISCCITPIVKVFKGAEVLEFFTMNSYEEWAATARGAFKTKYFKGLGTSTAKEAKEALSDIDSKLVAFVRDPQCDENMSLAFDSKRADDRKHWLMNCHDPRSCIDRTAAQCAVSDFINKELIHFSTYDCVRAIPNVMDGLKVSQRKIMYVALKHAARQEMKVGQLAPKVAELTDYHHGEQSLCGAVVGMAQTFVGANNINLLEPHGAFGTRLSGGADAASPRYIFTQVNPLAVSIFDARDACVLRYAESDGNRVEPEWYAPVLPMILINGALGIGTGFSTTVLKYRPSDVLRCIKLMLQDKAPKRLTPWYRGFTGTIRKDAPRKYTTLAKWDFIDKKRTLRITELPVGVWTDDYKRFCEKLLADKESPLDDVEYGNTDTVVAFRLVFKRDAYAAFRDMPEDQLVKELKLGSKLSETNMYLFDQEGGLQYFKTTRDILNYYFQQRLGHYESRKQALLEQLRYEVLILRNRAAFIAAVKQGAIDQRSMTEASLLKALTKQFQPDPRADGQGLQRFEYLVGMSYKTFTNSSADKMRASADAKERELERAEAMTARQMWGEDLAAIEHLLD